jgi:hypothetical protein
MIHRFYPSSAQRADRTLASTIYVANKLLGACDSGKRAGLCIGQKRDEWELTAPVGAHMRMFSLVS